ncbi:hypothetical protein [Caudoviricetes sp.]|nr:hypothetical protein [Caudoviricetes sp.]
MSYDAQKVKFGKQAVQFVELYLERCTRTYGTAPCTASIGGTGTKKCFNTFSSCQDTANFNTSEVVYRFATTRLDALQAANNPPVFPTLLSVDTAPTVLTPGKGLGIRSSVKVRIQDHPWTDTFTDPYFADRAYTPDRQGTFWGKFLTRNRYYVNRKIVVHTGFLTDAGEYDAANFVSRTYIITKITGPNGNGQVDIEAKDPLRLADGEKAKFPAPCKATLPLAITNSATTFSITDPDGAVEAQLTIGTLDQAYLRIDKEIVRVTAWSGTGTLSVTVVRAASPTFYEATVNVAEAHDAGASVQTTWLFNNAMAYDIVYKLLADAARLDTAYLPLSEWQLELDGNFSYMRFSRLLAEPMAVKDLLTEITEHGILIWWDERQGTVQMKGLQFYGLLGSQINDDNAIIANSVGVTEDTAALATQVWFNYAIRGPIEDPKLLKNYRLLDVRADLDAESADAYRYPQTMKILSKWLPPSGIGNVVSMGTVLLRQYSQIRKVISWEMDPKDDAYWVGDVVGVATRFVQDDEGLAAARNYLITSVDEVWSADGIKLKYVGTEQFSFLRVGQITHPDGAGGDPIPAPADYGAASSSEKNTWAYVGEDDGFFSDGTPDYQIQ